MRQAITLSRWVGIIGTCGAGWYFLTAGHWQAAAVAFLASAALQYRLEKRCEP